MNWHACESWKMSPKFDFVTFHPYKPLKKKIFFSFPIPPREKLKQMIERLMKMSRFTSAYTFCISEIEWADKLNNLQKLRVYAKHDRRDRNQKVESLEKWLFSVELREMEENEKPNQDVKRKGNRRRVIDRCCGSHVHLKWIYAV